MTARKQQNGKGSSGSDGKAPAKPVGWRSASQLKEEYVGGKTPIGERLEKLRIKLVGDIVAGMGCSEGEAAALVEAHLIGRRRPRRGREAYAASPEAVRLLGLTSKDDTSPRKPEGWQAVHEIAEGYRGGESTIGRKLEGLRVELVGDIVAGMGCSEGEAAALVEACLIGMRKTVGKGREGRSFSADVVRAAERFGKLVRKESVNGRE